MVNSRADMLPCIMHIKCSIISIKLGPLVHTVSHHHDHHWNGNTVKPVLKDRPMGHKKCGLR